MKFHIEATGSTLNHSPMLRRVEAFIDQLPDGLLITTIALASRLKLSLSAVEKYRTYISDELCARADKRTTKLYGNRKTIAAWKKAHPL